MYRYIIFLCSLVFVSACTQSGTDSLTTIGKGQPQSSIASPTYGSGKHQLTVFADFQCPACIAFSEVIGPVFEAYASAGHLQITYKQFPLTSHKNAERDALAALCSAEQGKYMEYKKSLYALEKAKSGGSVSDAERANAGKDILYTTKLAECISSDRYLDQVRREIGEGEVLGVNGTPTVFLDGKKLDNKIFSNMEAFQNIMNRWLEIPATSSGSVES